MSAKGGKGDKPIIPKPEAPVTKAHVAQNIYHPPKPTAKADAPARKTDSGAKLGDSGTTKKKADAGSSGKHTDLAPKKKTDAGSGGKHTDLAPKKKTDAGSGGKHTDLAPKKKTDAGSGGKHTDLAPKKKGDAAKSKKGGENILQKGLSSAFSYMQQTLHTDKSKPAARKVEAGPKPQHQNKAEASTPKGDAVKQKKQPQKLDGTDDHKRAKPAAKTPDKAEGKQTEKLQKPPESGFSLTNIAGRVIDGGKKLLMPEPEKPHVNKVENADKLTPLQRKQQDVRDWVDPKTGDRYDYDKDGLLKQIETKNKLKTTYEYKDGKPVNISRTQKILFWNTSVGSAEAVEGKVALSVNQDSGEARTSRHDVIEREDPQTRKVKKVEVKSEMVFNADGSKSAITSELDGRRISKELLSADDKKTGTVLYQYGDQPQGKPKADAPVLAVHFGTDNRPVHRYEFANHKAMQQQQVSVREDINYHRKGPVETERHETYDLRSGKEVIVNRTEKEVDYKEGRSKVHEQQFDKGKLATEQTVTYDERAKPIEMKYKDLSAKVDVSVSFDANGNSTDIKGNYKNYTDDDATMRKIMDGQAGRIMAQHDVKTLDAGEMLVYSERSAPREGTKPTGVIAWKEPGENTLSQAKAKDGIVYDAAGNKIGTVNDRGDVTLTGRPTFNILNDKQYGAIFHGVGTDDHPLNLYSSEGMNGYMSTQGNGDRVLMVGGNLISAQGEILGRMDNDGRMEFAKDLKQPQDAGTDIKSFMHGGFIFKGNENGNERRFFVDSISNGQMFVQRTDKNGNQILDANGKPVAPIDCEMRLGMVIDKSTNKQLYNFVPPDIGRDASYSGGFMISMGDSPKMTALCDMKGASFNVTVLGDQNTYKMVGIATGPQQFQADGTPVKGTGGVVNLQRELQLEDQNLKTRTDALKTRLDDENKGRMIGAISSPLMPGMGVVAAGAYNEATGGKAQTEAEKTAFDLARKHHDDQTAEINRIIATGQIDNNTLYKLQTGNERIRQSQLDQLERLQLLVNNPEHKLETITAKALDGTIKRPDLKHPGQVIDYEVRENLIYKKGSDRAIGHVNAQDGTMKIYDESGRVEVTKMSDRRLAGTVIHLEGALENGQKQSVDWLADGTGKLQSFAEMRKQAADQRKFFETLASDPSSTERAKEGLARTIHNEQRFNNTLDTMLKNGVRDVTVDKYGRINPGYEVRKIIEGPKQNIQAESFLLEERMAPKKVSTHPFNTPDECRKASGPMRIGSELYYCDKGQLYRTTAEGGKALPTGEPVGKLEPGYTVELNGRTVSLQNESQFLFQFKIDGDTKEHRVFGTGPAHIDASGNFVSGGLVEADELLVGGQDAKIAANKAMADYFFEKPGGNPIADVLGWSVNKGLLDREGQMRYVNVTIDNQNAAMKTHLDVMFDQGLTAGGLSNNRIDQGVHTINRFMKDLNLSATDMDQLSIEGRNIQRQTSESVAMAAMSLVPGGVTFAAGRLGAGSLLATSGVARAGVAFVAGGTISVATRQSHKVDMGTAFVSGGIEAGTMLAGAEGLKVLNQLKIVNQAKNIKTAEKLSEDALKVLYAEDTLKLVQSSGGKALLEIISKPGGEQAVEGMYRLANAGIQTTGLTLASSIREGNYDMMAPSKLVEGGLYMLASDAVAMTAHIPAPGIHFKSAVGQSADRFVKTFTADSINNFTNSLMTARVQAHEQELENISRERGIPKDLIDQKHFDLWKNQTRINSYLMQTAAEGMAMSFFTSPINHAMSDGAIMRQAISERTMNPKMAPDMMSPAARAAGHERLMEALPPTESRFGITRLSADGMMEIAPYSGGKFSFNVGDGKVSSIHDAQGRETTLTYDESGDLKTMHVNHNGHSEHWVKDGSEWLVTSEGRESRSKDKIAVTPDGQIVHVSDTGTHVFKLDGSVHLSDGKGQERTLQVNLNEDLRLNQALKLIEHTIPDRKIALRMQSDIYHLMERIITTGGDRKEFAKTLMHVSELLQDNPNAKLDAKTRQRLAAEALWLAANPTYLSQGNHPTCAIAAVEVRQYMEHPSDVMKALAEVAHTGQFRCPDGTVIRPFSAGDKWIFKPDTDAKVPYSIFRPAKAAGTADGHRLMASQIWQTLATTAHYATQDSFQGQHIGKGKIGYHNDFVSDMSTNPPRPLTKTDGTWMRGHDLLNAMRQLTGRTDNFAVINARHEVTEGNHSFKTERELTERLIDLKENAGYPVVYVIDTRNPPFSDPKGGPHMISLLNMEVEINPHDPRKISEINPLTNTISGATGERQLPHPDDIWITVDNQWTKGWDQSIKKIRLSDLYLASLDHEVAKREREARPARGNEPEEHREIPTNEKDSTRYSKEFQEALDQAFKEKNKSDERDPRDPNAPIEGFNETYEPAASDKKLPPALNPESPKAADLVPAVPPVVQKSRTEQMIELAQRMRDKSLSEEESNALAKQFMKLAEEQSLENPPLELPKDDKAEPARAARPGAPDARPRDEAPSRIKQNENIAKEPFLNKSLQSDSRSPEPFRTTAGQESGPKELLARDYATGRYAEPKLMSKGDRAIENLKRFVHFDTNPWFSDKTMDQFANRMLNVISGWKDITGHATSEQIDHRLQELQHAVDRFLKPLGLPSPTLKLGGESLVDRQAKASYALGGGDLFLRPESLLNSKNFNLGTILHELTHMTQDVSMLRLAMLHAADKGLFRPGDVRNELMKMTDLNIDLTSSQLTWLERVMEGSKDWLAQKSKLNPEQRAQDPELLRARELMKSFEFKVDKDSAKRRQVLEDRTQMLVELISPLDLSDRKQRRAYVAERLKDEPLGTSKPNLDPQGFLRKLAGDKEFREKLFGYDLLDPRFDASNERRKDLPPGPDQRMMSLMEDPELLRKHPQFPRLVINGYRDAWLKIMKSEFPDLEIPTGHKAITRLETKALLKAAEHFWPQDNASTSNSSSKSSRGEERPPLGALTEDSFKGEIALSIRDMLVGELKYNEDQKARINFANRYEIEPRVAAERLYQRVAERQPKLAEGLVRLQGNSEALNKAALEDPMVPGAVSEFGFEVMTAEAVDSDQHVSVAFIDLNNFKDVNTRFSQDSGDHALKVWGKEAQNILAKHEVSSNKLVLGHFGGDEYGILLQNVEPETALKIYREIQSIRIACKTDSQTLDSTTAGRDRMCLFEALSEGAVEPQNAVIVTATLGAVNRKEGQSVEDLLQTADKIMFKMKDEVKRLAALGEDTRINPFDSELIVTGEKESYQLQRYRTLSQQPESLKMDKKTYVELRKHFEDSVRERQLLLYEMLKKHRHTGLWGKDKSKEILQKFVDKNEPFTIVRLSTDNFKGVNDLFESHAKGNAVLKEIGKFMLDLKKEYKEDIQFLGSLSGTSPFMIIKDPAIAKEVMDKCDKFFLKVSKTEMSRIENFKDANQDNLELPVGFSAAGTEFHPDSGLTAEDLLNLGNEQLEAVENEHAIEKRRNRREPKQYPKAGEVLPQNRSTDKTAE
jgi:YD repeat-containing protein